MTNHNEVIDLTNSFIEVAYITMPDVINLDTDEDSLIIMDDIATRISRHSNITKAKKKSTKTTRKSDPKLVEDEAPPKNPSLGKCPICFTELGVNPLASTICGHVYCMACLKESLKVNSKCPTCRKPLKGRNAYHELYITLDCN